MEETTLNTFAYMGDNSRMNLTEMELEIVDWIRLGQDRFHWQPPVSTEIKLRVP
jgi:hypothetical protein